MLRQVHEATLPMCKRMAEMSHSSSKRSIVTTFLFATKCNSISGGGGIKTLHYCTTNNPVLRKPLHPSRAAPLLINSKVNMSREDNWEDGIIHLNHTEYKEMEVELSRSDNLGPLDTACKVIFAAKLRVSLRVLQLNALNLTSHNDPIYGQGTEMREMKKAGLIKIGKFNQNDKEAVLKRWKALLVLTGLKEEDLKKALFEHNQTDHQTDRSFKLERQQIGFWLLQDVDDGKRRLPLEVIDMLAVLFYSGPFSKEDDAAILAWVEEHGLTGWMELARSIARWYLRAGAAVKTRYEELNGTLMGNKSGAYCIEEVRTIIKEVLKQDPNVFEKPLDESNIKFKAIASLIRRSSSQLFEFYAISVHSIVMRHKAGTLEKDVRGDLIQEVKKQKNWIYSVDIEFDKVAAMPKFQGHNRTSLYKLYKTMMKCVTLRTGQKSVKEVTVEQMENYWRTSKRIGKKKKLLEKEKEIVEAYLEIKRELLGD